MTVLSATELENLRRRHAPALVMLARGRCPDPEDCVQDAFIRLAAQSPSPRDPHMWLLRVVRNTAVNQNRSLQRQRRREHVAGQLRDPWLEPSNPADKPADADALTQAVKDLDDELRDVLIAHVWGGLTFRQIGDAFGISHAAAHRRYQAALAWLRNHFPNNPTS